MNVLVKLAVALPRSCSFWTSIYSLRYIDRMTVKLPIMKTSVYALSSKVAVPAPLRLLSDLEAPPATEVRRRRIWEMTSYFHCSIIGTCLTTSELRQILVKMRLVGAERETDHELHGRAVRLAGQKDLASKLLQKALDRRHRSAIGQFSKAKNAEELRELWEGAVQRAEIPGAYWAVLTHPEATEDLVRKVFGEVHMLSHLVGAANRADIRRLRELEAENAELQEKVARQQQLLRDAVVTRDATIASLSETLGKAIASAQHGRGDSVDSVGADETTIHLVADLRRRLVSEGAYREKLQSRLAKVMTERDQERKLRGQWEQRHGELARELDAAEISLTARLPTSDTGSERSGRLDATTLLYVGGRAHQVAQLRMLAEQWGATFLHHDGGIEDRSGLLESQVARADAVFFPVDCVSHNAVGIIKRASRQMGKSFHALRSSGLTSFAAALSTIATKLQATMPPEENPLKRLNV